MPQELKDEEIIRRTLLDKEAFALLIERYEAKLLCYLERLGVGVLEDREDILQDAFVKAYKNLNSFDPTLTFSSWVYRITPRPRWEFLFKNYFFWTAGVASADRLPSRRPFLRYRMSIGGSLRSRRRAEEVRR